MDEWSLVWHSICDCQLYEHDILRKKRSPLVQKMLDVPLHDLLDDIVLTPILHNGCDVCVNPHLLRLVLRTNIRRGRKSILHHVI